MDGVSRLDCSKRYRGLHDLLERAAKFGCYLFVNKLVFHEALLKKYGKTMAPLNAPPEITTGDDLQMRLQHFFAEAKQVTGITRPSLVTTPKTWDVAFRSMPTPPYKAGAA